MSASPAGGTAGAAGHGPASAGAAVHPCAAALQIIIRELWQTTTPGGPLGRGES